MDVIDSVEGGLHYHVKIKNVSTGLYARVAPSYNTDTLFAESDDSFKIVSFGLLLEILLFS